MSVKRSESQFTAKWRKALDEMTNNSDVPLMKEDFRNISKSACCFISLFILFDALR